jgi:cellulase/cellobiase CelA1
MLARQAWNGGFVDNVTLTNTGSTTVSGWAVAYTLPGHPTIGNTWNAAIAQSGTSGVSVTARNLDYNAGIAAGASTSFGYQAADPANGAPPTAFTANGKACTTG